MNDLAPDAPAVGHNQPPLARPEDLPATLESLYADVLARVDRILARRDAADVPITSDEQDAKIADFVAKQVMALIDECGDLHKKEKAPYFEAGKIVDRVFLDRKKGLEDLKAICARRSTAWKRAKEEIEIKKRQEEARVAAEIAAKQPQSQSAQEAAKEAAQAAAVPAAEITRTRGAHGGTSSLRKKWTFEIVDAKKVPKQYLSPDPAKIKAAIALADDPATLEIAGIKIFEDASTSFRR